MRRYSAVGLVCGLLLCVPLLCVPCAAAEQDAPVDVSWELFKAPLDAGSLVLVVWLTPHTGHYAYGHEPGPTGLPTDLALTAPPGLEAQVFYPPGERKPDSFDPSLTVETYQGRTPVFVLLRGEAPRDLILAGRLQMLLCSDTSCWPVKRELVMEWPDLAPQALPEAREQPWWPRFQALSQGGGETATSRTDARQAPPEPLALEAHTSVEALDLEPRFFQPGLEVRGLGKAMLFAVLAGFILNFMPCVLPVVSLKLSTFVAASGVGESGAKIRRFREHNVFFALGILLYFTVLGGVLGSAGLAWGQIFQKPGLVLGVTAVVFGLGLSLFGLFDLPIVDLKTGGQAKNPRTQALFTGFLATLLATPCSGPFLGGVLGWTLTRAPATIIAVFLCIGLGMALPYILMAIQPGLVRLFPKPGAWTGFLERFVAFFLMGTCVYLLSILPEAYMLQALVLLLATAFAAWIWGGWTTLSDPAGRRAAIRLVAVFVLCGAAAWAFQPPDTGTAWRPFAEKDFQRLLGEENLLVDFTADWCPNCKVLEKTTLSAANLEKWQERYQLTLLQADLSEEHPAALALLQRLGSQSIPVVAVFPKGEQSVRPLVLRDIFTASQMESALRQALGPQH